MERTAMTKLTAEELKGYTKEDMIALVMQMQERLLAFIVAFAALLFPQQGQCNTTLCQLTVNVRIVRFNVQAHLYLYGKSIRFESALVMSSSTGHCMVCLSISAKISRTVCREQ